MGTMNKKIKNNKKITEDIQSSSLSKPQVVKIVTDEIAKNTSTGGLSKPQVVKIVTDEIAKLPQHTGSGDVSSSIENRMNVLEKLYGPRKKTRGSIEDGYS